jgi:hypothetical protein
MEAAGGRVAGTGDGCTTDEERVAGTGDGCTTDEERVAVEGRWVARARAPIVMEGAFDGAGAAYSVTANRTNKNNIRVDNISQKMPKWCQKPHSFTKLI